MSRKKPLPPTIFFAHLLMAVGLHLVVPVIQVVKTPYRFSGVLLMGVGLWLNIWADNLFKKEKTTVKPFETTSALVIDGPFRFSRHPMYLGMVVALLGTAIILGSLVAFIIPFVFLLIMEAVFIRHEEKAIEDVFGREYLDYKSRVRRWI